jgi:energy-coupling factor transport system permease protein
MDWRQITVRDPTALLPAADAVAKLGAALIVMVVAFASRDVVTPSVLLVGIGATLLVSGISGRDLARLTGPLVVAAAVLGFLNGLLAGTPVSADPVATQDRALVGLALGLRVAVIALAGSVALATTDPADLAAGLTVHLRFPQRVTVGALATLRLLPLLAAEWHTIRLARRARGVDAGRNPVVAIQLAFGALFTLLVSAIRHAGRMATAMDARGFSSATRRSVARPPRFRRSDLLLLVAAVGWSSLAVAISVAAGTWAFVFG